MNKTFCTQAQHAHIEKHQYIIVYDMSLQITPSSFRRF